MSVGCRTCTVVVCMVSTLHLLLRWMDYPPSYFQSRQPCLRLGTRCMRDRLRCHLVRQSMSQTGLRQMLGCWSSSSLVRSHVSVQQVQARSIVQTG
eukprot:33627_1